MRTYLHWSDSIRQENSLGKYLSLALALALVSVISSTTLEEQEEDEGWTRPAVVKALLVHIENIALNCSLTMIDSKYPVVYPSGRGSSHQFVVGCLPTTATDLNDGNYLWQLQEHCVDSWRLGCAKYFICLF